jgi:hypothetical protein
MTTPLATRPTAALKSTDTPPPTHTPVPAETPVSTYTYQVPEQANEHGWPDPRLGRSTHAADREDRSPSQWMALRLETHFAVINQNKEKSDEEETAS